MAALLVRRAESRDFPALVRLCQQAGDSGVCPGVLMDPDSIREFAERLLAFEDGMLYVAELGEDVVAAGGAVVLPYHFNRNLRYANGVFLWRDPAFPGAGGPIVSALERWAKRKGATKILLTINDTLPRSERGREFLSRRGYEPEETNFVRTL